MGLTMTMTISGPMPHANGSITISDTAAARAKMDFNPSSNDQVTRIKTLVAALYTELEAIAPAGERSEKAREAATAATHIQSGAMFAVSAIFSN
jgi:hypothetical protein